MCATDAEINIEKISAVNIDSAIRQVLRDRAFSYSKINMGLRSNQVHSSEILMPESKNLTQTEYSPIGPSKKLNLLLQRSLRYSYRQRCCRCCPTILCELLFPIILMVLLVLARYGTNELIKNLDDNPYFNYPRCSQESNASMVSSSKDILNKCFQFPPSYEVTRFSPGASNRTNIIFHPVTNDTE